MRVTVLYATLCAVIGVVPAAAQQPAATAVMHAEGAVFIDDKEITAGATVPEASLLRTASGRAIVRLSQGGVIALDHNTHVRIRRNHPYNFNRIEILEGTAIVMSERAGPLVTCQNETQLSAEGIFRFDVRPPYEYSRACRFRLFEGAAAVPLRTVLAVLRAGDWMELDPRCGDLVPTMRFAREDLDAFDKWSRHHAAIVARGEP